MFNIVMYVNCGHGEFFLMKIYCFNILFGAHQVEDVNLFIFQLSKFIVFIFRLFQSLELIKYLFYSTYQLFKNI
jgi:hypothetical protein